MKRRNIRFATICLSWLVAAVSISMIAAPSLVPNASAQPSGQQKGEKATPKELVTTDA